MTSEQIAIMQTCAQGALSGELDFGAIVSRLTAAGVERYHADYSRCEITYYLPEGESFVVALPHERYETGSDFCAATVEAAVRQSQRHEHSYLDFVRKTMEAGCVGYFVQLTGRCVIYFGRQGERHVEHFPAVTA